MLKSMVKGAREVTIFAGGLFIMSGCGIKAGEGEKWSPEGVGAQRASAGGQSLQVPRRWRIVVGGYLSK